MDCRGAHTESPRSSFSGTLREAGCRGAPPSRDLVNLTGERPPQTTRRGHRVAEQLLGAHRRPCWAHSGGQVLGAFGRDPHQTGISARKPPPPRRPYATRSRSAAARISGRYGCYASMRQASSSNITILRRSEAVAAPVATSVGRSEHCIPSFIRLLARVNPRDPRQLVDSVSS